MKDPHLQIEVGYVELLVNIIDGSYRGRLGYIHRVVNLHYQHVEILGEDKIPTGKIVAHISNDFSESGIRKDRNPEQIRVCRCTPALMRSKQNKRRIKMIIREKWHHDEHCTIYVFFEGDGNPSHDHKIVGMRYIDNTGKTGFNAKGIGNQLFDKETFKG